MKRANKKNYANTDKSQFIGTSSIQPIKVNFCWMKQLFFAIAFIIPISLIAQPGAAITFTSNEHDFGKIDEVNGKVTTVFEFVNTGNAPLIIQNVEATCGCTTPDWTKKPVMPGQKGSITAIYDPANRPGKFEKQINVFSNAANESLSILTIKGNVKPKEQYQ
jgi:hypothetical protein